jgi:hypothetical protein
VRFQHRYHVLDEKFAIGSRGPSIEEREDTEFAAQKNPGAGLEGWGGRENRGCESAVLRDAVCADVKAGCMVVVDLTAAGEGGVLKDASAAAA